MANLQADKSNGNCVYADSCCHTDNAVATTATATSTTQNTTNTINIMTGAAAAAAVAASLPTSASCEDLDLDHSQSLSEYTDADESISAPTEFLAEFLSAVMLKDYKKALKYCKLILQYEPNNTTAKEFYPLILDKLRVAAASDSDENYNKSSSPELNLELELEAAADCEEEEDSVSSNSSDADNDDEVDAEPEDEEESSSGDDYELPIDEPQDVAAVGSLAAHSHSLSHHNSGSSRNSSSGSGGRSDNTTHSYSSLLLEDDNDIVPLNLQFGNKDCHAADLDVSNGNKLASASCSDSESPTEPLTQRLAAILRSKCGVSASNDDNY
ncbi:CG14853 [Drosophila busckii]|uniref:CG14853 n=1 Tax=Drosophila busckii TaxID=30019 RepID=A0A0M4ELZ7_DROBS|nr:clumping factor A [Drosophila busckii]ALC45438.1 CG14853 [Drosophila busckii]